MGPSSPGPRPTVCVVSPTEGDYSQTFVRAHIDRLPARVIPLYGGPAPGAAGSGAGEGRRVRRGVAGVVARLQEALVRGDFYPNRVGTARPSEQRSGGRRAPGARSGPRRPVGLSGKAIDLVFSELAGSPAPPLWRRAMERFLVGEGVDAVLAEFGWAGVRLMRPCRAVGVPLVVHFHGADAYRDTWLDRLDPLYDELFETAAAIVAVSTDMRDQLVGLGAPAEKVTVNPCGVDPDLFDGADPIAAPPVFVAVGRFVEKKGPELTLEAFHHVVAERPEARLVMIGDGELLADCRERVERWGIGHAVDFRGVRSHAEVAIAMRGARGLVQHSVRASDGDMEGTPVAVLEAGASGLPVVATRHGGIVDVVIHDGTGLLVEERDTDGMARHMVALLDDPGRAADLGARGRDRIRAHYSMDRSVRRLMAVIEAAIAGRPAGDPEGPTDTGRTGPADLAGDPAAGASS